MFVHITKGPWIAGDNWDAKQGLATKLPFKVSSDLVFHRELPEKEKLLLILSNKDRDIMVAYCDKVEAEDPTVDWRKKFEEIGWPFTRKITKKMQFQAS